MAATTMTVDDALDGKTEIVRRFMVDEKALRQQTKPRLVQGTAARLQVRPGLGETDFARLAFDRKMLQLTEVFAWDDRLARMVKESAKKLPLDVPFSRAWLYTPSGIWWFGRDSQMMILQNTEGDPTGGEERRRCCGISFWAEPDDPDTIVVWGYSYDHNEPTPGPVPTACITLKGGETLDGMYQKLLSYQRAALEKLEEPMRVAMGHAYEHGNHVGTSAIELADYAVQHGLASMRDYQQYLEAMRKLAWIKSVEKIMRFFVAGSLWIQQKILVYNAGTMTRHARKRAEKLAYIPKVNVVELRRREYAYPPGTEGHSEVEWSCSWLVRGHWRNQPCGTERAERKLIWIDPFVKGDPEKPMKNTERVFAVRR